MSVWRERHGYDLLQPQCASVYGYGTELWLAAKRRTALDLAHIIAPLEAMLTAYHYQEE